MTDRTKIEPSTPILNLSHVFAPYVSHSNHHLHHNQLNLPLAKNFGDSFHVHEIKVNKHMIYKSNVVCK